MLMGSSLFSLLLVLLLACLSLVLANNDWMSQVQDAFLNNPSIDRAVLLVGTAASGRVCQVVKGDDISETTLLASASLIKWVTGTVILQLQQAGILTQDNPQAYLDWWTDDDTDPRSCVTMAQLLSFTSGFRGKPSSLFDTPACIRDPDSTTTACAQEIYENWFDFAPGTTYFYGPSHHQVLGAVAQAAANQSWAQIFQDTVAGPFGMEETVYDRPSTSNPRLSGGARTTARDVERFLVGLLQDKALLDRMVVDGTPTGVVDMEETPISDYPFHYGPSVWLECTESTWEACQGAKPTKHPEILSGTGAFGFHAWINRTQESYGVLAMEMNDGASVALSTALDLRPLIQQGLDGVADDDSSSTRIPTNVPNTKMPTNAPITKMPTSGTAPDPSLIRWIVNLLPVFEIFRSIF